MIELHYSVNGEPGLMRLPKRLLELCPTGDLAELVTSHFWRNRPAQSAAPVSLVQLMDTDGKSLGVFEVHRNMRPIFTATPLQEA